MKGGVFVVHDTAMSSRCGKSQGSNFASRAADTLLERCPKNVKKSGLFSVLVVAAGTKVPDKDKDICHLAPLRLQRLAATLYTLGQLDSDCFCQIKLHYVMLEHITNNANAKHGTAMQLWYNIIERCGYQVEARTVFGTAVLRA